MAFKAIADNATEQFLSFVKSRAPDPAFDTTTQTLVRLPRAPSINTERWDSSNGASYQTKEDGSVDESSVPIRGLNATEQAELDAVAELQRNREQINNLVDDPRKFYYMMRGMMILHNRQQVIIAQLLITRPAEENAEMNQLVAMAEQLNQLAGG